MKTCISSMRGRAPVRLCASVVAVFAAFPVLAQVRTATLPDVVVTATRFDAEVSTLPFGVSVITKDDISRSGVSTVNEAVIKLLGVPGRADFFGGGNSSLDLRGFGEAAGNNQVVIVDGIRMSEADQGGTRLSGIAINSVERIEVLRGSGAVLYGDGATGGVIVITTKAGLGVSRKNSADLYAATGSYGLNEVRANATLVAGGFSLDVAGNKRMADNHRDNFESTAQGSSVQAQWRNDWLRLGASYANDSLDSGLPGSLSMAQYQVNPSQTTKPNDKGTIQGTRQTVFVRAQLSDWQLAADVGQRTKDVDSLFSGSPYAYKIDADTLALRAKHESKFGSLQNALTLGHDQAQWNRGVVGGSESQQKNSAFYAQDELTLSGGTRLSAGYRSENIKQSDTVVASTDSDLTAWELGLVQPLSQSWSVFGRVGSSFRLANIDESGFTVASALLKPQTSRDLEFGNRWKYSGGRVELRFYRSNLNNELGYDPTVANPQWWDSANKGANVNFDPTQRQGLEFESHHELSKSLGLQVNAGVREAKFTQGAHDGKAVPLVPTSTLALRADWHPNATHSFNAGVVRVASQNSGGDFFDKFPMPAYTTVDVRYMYRFENLEFSLGVTNLLNEKYYSQAFVNFAGTDVGIYPEAGRTFTAALRVSFQ
jgi:iron complex outermembrane recepter protein